MSKDTKFVARGKFYLKDGDSKKKSKKKREEQIRIENNKKNKRLIKQCECDHIDAKKKKAHFDYSADGMMKVCKICGGTLYADKGLYTKENVESAVVLLYSVMGLTRNKLHLDEKMDKQITNFLQTLMKTPELLEAIKAKAEQKKGKKNKKNKNKNKSKNNFRRISY